MLKIKVVSHYGETFQTQMTVEFGSRGGAIGRQDDCLLPLPDPQRHVSRKHAHISWDGSHYLIQNVSANNFVIVSGRTLNVNEAVPLKLGQQIYIGHYLLEVESLEDGARPAAAPATPATTPQLASNDASAPIATPDLATASPVFAIPDTPSPDTPAEPPAHPASQSLDILGLGTPASDANDDPFAVLGMPSSQASMPDDPLFNPAELGIARIEPVKRAELSAEPFSLPSLGVRNTPDTLLAPHGTAPNGHEQGIADLIGKTKGIDELYPDPGRLLPSDDILSNKSDDVGSLGAMEPHHSLDPMVLFGEQAGTVTSLLDFTTSKTVDDHANSLVMHMEMPKSVHPDTEAALADALPPVEHIPLPDNLFLDLFPASASASAAQQPPEPEPAAAPAIDPLAAMGFSEDAVAVADDLLAGAPLADAAPEHTSNETNAAAPSIPAPASDIGQLRQTPTAPASEASSQTRQEPANSGELSAEKHQALIKAFLKGAGLPEDSIPDHLTPEFMETVGSMLYCCMQGTVDLIAARAATKREVNAEMTLIVPVHNNPLKFVPDGRAALIHMFGKQIPGFLGPIAAMEDAYKDLRAHQVGVFAGMRAALAEVLQRFSPGNVDKRLDQHSMLDYVVPTNRKSKLWDLYSLQFNRIYSEAQEDFDVIFGDAFAVAYEEQAKSAKKTYETHGGH